MKPLALLISLAIQPLLVSAATQQVNIAQLRATNSIPLVSSHQRFPGWPAIAANHARYNKQIRTASAAATTTGQAYLSFFVTEYLAPVTIGEETFYLQIDTGSSDLWVVAFPEPELYISQRTCQDFYLRNYAYTGQLCCGQTWNVTYADNSTVKGYVYHDTVTLGGITATGQGVQVVTGDLSTLFNVIQYGSDGVIGLGLDATNTCRPDKCPTWISNVAPQLQSNLFTVTLKRTLYANPQVEAPLAGSIDFGYIDPDKYSGKIVYSPVTNTIKQYGPLWEFKVTSCSIVVSGATSYTGKSFYAIADTGTTLTYLDDTLVKTYWSKVKGAKIGHGGAPVFDIVGWTFPCSSSLPSMTINIANTNYVIPSGYFNYSANQDINFKPDGTCLGGLQSNANLGFSIIGDSFLQVLYAVFDRGNSTSAPRLGFAQQKGITS